MPTLMRLAATVRRNLMRQRSPCALTPQRSAGSCDARQWARTRCELPGGGHGSLDSAASPHGHAVSVARLATRPLQRGLLIHKVDHGMVAGPRQIKVPATRPWHVDD
jgi:hypothetical protein